MRTISAALVLLSGAILVAAALPQDVPERQGAPVVLAGALIGSGRPRLLAVRVLPRPGPCLTSRRSGSARRDGLPLRESSPPAIKGDEMASDRRSVVHWE